MIAGFPIYRIGRFSVLRADELRHSKTRKLFRIRDAFECGEWEHGEVRHQILSDGTIWLSVPAEQDIDAIARLCRHSSIGEWTTIPVPYSRSDAAAFVRNLVPKGWADRNPTWAVRMVDGGPVIGMIGLHRHRNDDGAAEIGYWLAPTARGRGLMTRAVNMVCDFAFAPGGMRLERVDWRAFVGNQASAAVVARAGFHYEGTVRGGAIQRGKRRDEWIGGRLRTDPRGILAVWPEHIVPEKT